MSQSRPVEKIVHHALILGHKLVQLIHQYHAWHSPGARMIEFPLQQTQSMSRTNPLTFYCFPQQRIRLVRISHLHTVDLHENEIVQFLCEYAGVELRNDFAYRGGFARAGRPGDVNAGARAGGNGGFEVIVDGREFGHAAREGDRNGRDVEGGAGELEGG